MSHLLLGIVGGFALGFALVAIASLPGPHERACRAAAGHYVNPACYSADGTHLIFPWEASR